MTDEDKNKLLKSICPHNVGEWKINNSASYQMVCVTCKTELYETSSVVNPFGLVDNRFKVTIR